VIAAATGSATRVRVTGLKVHFPVRQTLLSALIRGERGRAFVRAVDGVDFSVTGGEVFGLAGESGRGKTRTGKVLVRLEDPTGGTVQFDGGDGGTIRS